MAIIDISGYSPTSVSMSMIGMTAAFISPLTGATQTLDRGGLRWEAIYTFENVHHDKRAELMGLLAKLRAQSNRIRVPVHDNPKRGGYGGTPLVSGASQTGSSINIDGVTNKTNWIRAGDYFGIEVNGESELKICTADANSSGGAVTVEFEPRLRQSPGNNEPIIVEDGVLGKPTGIFFLKDPTIGWSSRPLQQGSELSSITMAMTEDLFYTQT